MTDPNPTDAEEPTGPLRVTMRIWHPGCWKIDLTERVDAGILAHDLSWVDDERGYARLTVYGDTTDAVDAAIERARESPGTYAVHEASEERPAVGAQGVAGGAGSVAGGGAAGGAGVPGNATRELVVERSRENQISEPLLAKGFVLDRPLDVRNGVEEWTVLTALDRETVGRRLGDLRADEDADVEVTGIAVATASGGGANLPLDQLTARQREVFDLARERGYYDWPRRTTAADLAAELDITTSTLHEHLHKAEAKLLDDRYGRD